MARAARTVGREQRRNTPTAKARTPALDAYYRYNLPPITPGDFEFQLQLIRPGLAAFSLDTMTDALSWDDEQSTLTGSVTLHRPDPEDPGSLPVRNGDRIRCRVRWEAAWFELWTMRCQPPQTQLDQNTVTVGLVDDMDVLDRSKRDWTFRATKRRPFGYFAHEIARIVARDCGVKLGNIAKGTVRITLNLSSSSGLDVLKAAYQKEKAHSGRSFVLRLRNGALDVVPLRRNPQLYVLGSQLQTAMLSQTSATDTPATVLTGRGQVGKGKSAVKVSYTAYDRAVVRRFGYAHQTKNYGVIASHAALRAAVKRDLAAMLKIEQTATLQAAGIPFILRGDGVKLDLPREGFKGAAAFVFATRANHTVQGNLYQTQWDFSSTDPYLAQQQADQQAAHKRAVKRAARRRKAGKR